MINTSLTTPPWTPTRKKHVAARPVKTPIQEYEEDNIELNLFTEGRTFSPKVDEACRCRYCRSYLCDIKNDFKMMTGDV